MTEIETIDYGHRKLAHMLDTSFGTVFTIKFGDTVSDAWIRFMAPILAKKELKPKGEQRNEKFY